LALFRRALASIERARLLALDPRPAPALQAPVDP
jgi:hypothetical protein